MDQWYEHSTVSAYEGTSGRALYMASLHSRLAMPAPVIKRRKCRNCGTQNVPIALDGTLGECQNPQCKHNRRLFQLMAFRRMNDGFNSRFYRGQSQKRIG